MTIPNGFTAKEYADYQHCIKKLTIGDTVYGYFRNTSIHNQFRSSTIKTDLIFPLIVVAKTFRPSLSFILGSNRDNIGFWRLNGGFDDRTVDLLYPGLYNRYTTGYYVANVSDMRIARIEKRAEAIEPIRVKR